MDTEQMRKEWPYFRGSANKAIHELCDEVDTLREALTFYADERANEGDRLVRDGGNRARAALGEKNDD